MCNKSPKIIIGLIFVCIAMVYAITLLTDSAMWKAWVIGCLSVGVTSWLFSNDTESQETRSGSQKDRKND